jgi:hypothetical protein
VRTSDLIFAGAIACGAVAMAILDRIDRWLRQHAPEAARAIGRGSRFFDLRGRRARALLAAHRAARPASPLVPLFWATWIASVGGLLLALALLLG